MSLLLLPAFFSAWAATGAKGLSADQAREVLGRWVGAKSAVKIKEVSSLGATSVVTAEIEATFRFAQDAQGHWYVAEVRRGNNNWVDVGALRQALEQEKESRARAELDLLAEALEAFKRERGFYVPARSGAELAESLSPRYLRRVLRLDPWQQPYEYEVSGAGYILRSRGADAQARTADDLIVRR